MTQEPRDLVHKPLEDQGEGTVELGCWYYLCLVLRTTLKMVAHVVVNLPYGEQMARALRMANRHVVPVLLTVIFLFLYSRRALIWAKVCKLWAWARDPGSRPMVLGTCLAETRQPCF